MTENMGNPSRKRDWVPQVIIAFWLAYWVLVTFWAITLVGIHYAGDPALVLKSYEEHRFISALGIHAVGFVVLARVGWRFQASLVQHPVDGRGEVRRSRWRVGSALLLGVTFVGIACAPLVLTTSDMAYDAVGGQVEGRLSVVSWLVAVTPVLTGLAAVSIELARRLWDRSAVMRGPL